MKKRIILTILGLTLIACGICKIIAKNKPECIEYCVADGDTLWEIADKYYSNSVDIRKCIYEIEKINEIDAEINPGDIILIPVEK